MEENIYLSEFNVYRNALTDTEQIIWFWQQYVKRYKSKNHITRFWLNLLERHEKHLNKIQAYELLDFLKSKVSEEQILNRVKAQLFAKINAQLEMEKWQEWNNNYKLKLELTRIVSLN